MIRRPPRATLLPDTTLFQSYAGPAKTPAGYASGSFGPTTAGRMDSYVDLFQSHGGSMVMLAKGNRSQQVTDACKQHRSEEHTSELQSRQHLVCRLLLEYKQSRLHVFPFFIPPSTVRPRNHPTPFFDPVSSFTIYYSSPPPLTTPPFAIISDRRCPLLLL